MTENVHFPHDHPESQDKLKCRICTVYYILFFQNQFNTHEIKHFRYGWTIRLKYQKNRRQNSQQTPSPRPKDKKIGQQQNCPKQKEVDGVGDGNSSGHKCGQGWLSVPQSPFQCKQ